MRYPCSRGGSDRQHLTYTINTWCAITPIRYSSELELFAVNTLQAINTECGPVSLRQRTWLCRWFTIPSKIPPCGVYRCHRAVSREKNTEPSHLSTHSLISAGATNITTEMLFTAGKTYYDRLRVGLCWGPAWREDALIWEGPRVLYHWVCFTIRRLKSNCQTANTVRWLTSVWSRAGMHAGSLSQNIDWWIDRQIDRQIDK